MKNNTVCNMKRAGILLLLSLPICCDTSVMQQFHATSQPLLGFNATKSIYCALMEKSFHVRPDLCFPNVITNRDNQLCLKLGNHNIMYKLNWKRTCVSQSIIQVFFSAMTKQMQRFMTWPYKETSPEATKLSIKLRYLIWHKFKPTLPSKDSRNYDNFVGFLPCEELRRMGYVYRMSGCKSISNQSNVSPHATESLLSTPRPFSPEASDAPRTTVVPSSLDLPTSFNNASTIQNELVEIGPQHRRIIFRFLCK